MAVQVVISASNPNSKNREQSLHIYFAKAFIKYLYSSTHLILSTVLEVDTVVTLIIEEGSEKLADLPKTALLAGAQVQTQTVSILLAVLLPLPSKVVWVKALQKLGEIPGRIKAALSRGAK